MSNIKPLTAEQATLKEAAVQALFEQTKSYLNQSVDRDSLNRVMHALIELASHQDWWCLEQYEEPDNESLQNRYLIHKESDDGYALYLNIMKPGKKVVPHDHTTWACIAGVVGTETNFIYERLDDGSVPGHATLRQRDTVMVGPGNGVALLGDDIHAVKIEDNVIRHLHFYGRPLEMLNERKAFNLDDNSYTIKDIGVQSR
ncbi:MAG: cysteine dioxygenase family protein [Alcaligenaceae bacterium]|nr:cysteine dioxygenase family protein [Alcaligenaceae bacterium]